MMKRENFLQAAFFEALCVCAGWVYTRDNHSLCFIKGLSVILAQLPTACSAEKQNWGTFQTIGTRNASA